jgi:hypothetical protein
MERMRIAISRGMLSPPLWNPAKSLISFARNWVTPGSVLREPGGTWRFPVGSKSPDRVLTVLSVEEEGPHSNSKEQIPSGAKAYLSYPASHDAEQCTSGEDSTASPVTRVYDAAGNAIEMHEHKGDFREW